MHFIVFAALFAVSAAQIFYGPPPCFGNGCNNNAPCFGNGCNNAPCFGNGCNAPCFGGGCNNNAPIVIATNNNGPCFNNNCNNNGIVFAPPPIFNPPVFVNGNNCGNCVNNGFFGGNSCCSYGNRGCCGIFRARRSHASAEATTTVAPEVTETKAEEKKEE